MSDTELMELFRGNKEENNIRYREMLVQMPYFTKELKCTGVTRQLLWEEYSKNNPNAFGYLQFSSSSAVHWLFFYRTPVNCLSIMLAFIFITYFSFLSIGIQILLQLTGIKYIIKVFSMQKWLT